MLMSVNLLGRNYRGMETQWYIPPGKTLEKTKIDDRSLSLHSTEKAWENITDHLQRKKRKAEATQKKIDHDKYLKETSEAMTRNWDNSVENIRRRKEEERQRREAEQQEEKMTRFLQLRKEQEEARTKYIADKKKELYISHGRPMNLTSALIFGDVIYEREKQKEMKAHIKNHEKEVEMEWAKKIWQGAIDEQNENAEKAQKIWQKKKEMGKLYLEEIQKHKEDEDRERETRKNLEIEDILAAHREMDLIKKVEAEERRNRVEDIKKNFDEFYRRQRIYKEKAEKEDREQSQAIEVCGKAKCKIEALRLKKEEEILESKNRRAQLIAEKTAAIAQGEAAEEERRLKAAIEEREQMEQEQLRKKEAYQQRLVQERKESYNKFLKKKEQMEHEEVEMKKWITLNRYRIAEVVKEKEIEKKKKERQAKLDYSDVLCKQMKENDEVREKIAEEERAIHREEIEKFKKADEKFFKYAEEVTEEAKSREGGRNLIPIERVILEYKKENALIAPKQERRCMQLNRLRTEDLINCTPGKRRHKPEADPNYKRCERGF